MHILRRQLAAAALLAPLCLHAQTVPTDPVAIVRAAVDSQLAADRNDTTNWICRVTNGEPGHITVSTAVGSPQGELRRIIEVNGRPADPALVQSETDRIRAYIDSPSAQAANHKSAVHDDQQATELLKMLPTAFTWSIASETPSLITLNYRPNPNFEGPDMQSRVMSTMAGQLVINHTGDQYRIKTFRGALVADYKIAYGMLGRLYKGGTFDVERSQIAPGYWEITDTHIHIAGHVLLFKTIGTQEDEVKSDCKPSPATSLRAAAALLGVTP
jgi:hypothetical protein